MNTLRKSLFPKAEEQALETDVLLDSVPVNVLEGAAVAKGTKSAYKNRKKISKKLLNIFKKAGKAFPPIAAGSALTSATIKELKSEDFLDKIITK